MDCVDYLDIAKHACETRGNGITHNDDKESHLNTLDAQVTHSAFSMRHEKDGLQFANRK